MAQQGNKTRKMKTFTKIFMKEMHYFSHFTEFFVSDELTTTYLHHRNLYAEK